MEYEFDMDIFGMLFQFSFSCSVFFQTGMAVIEVYFVLFYLVALKMLVFPFKKANKFHYSVF